MSDKPKGTSWAKRQADRPPEVPASADEANEAAFSTKNAAKRQEQITLDLRFKNGSRMGLSYAYLTTRHFDPTNGITLEMAGYKVVIKGKNLKRLYRRLLINAVGSIQEVDEMNDSTEDVDSIRTSVYSIKTEEV